MCVSNSTACVCLCVLVCLFVCSVHPPKLKFGSCFWVRIWKPPGVSFLGCLIQGVICCVVAVRCVHAAVCVIVCVPSCVFAMSSNVLTAGNWLARQRSLCQPNTFDPHPLCESPPVYFRRFLGPSSPEDACSSSLVFQRSRASLLRNCFLVSV